jgi:hypothetical protein
MHWMSALLNDTERRREVTICTALCTHWMSALLTDTERRREVTICTALCTHHQRALPAFLLL